MEKHYREECMDRTGADDAMAADEALARAETERNPQVDEPMREVVNSFFPPPPPSSTPQGELAFECRRLQAALTRFDHAIVDILKFLEGSK